MMGSFGTKPSLRIFLPILVGRCSPSPAARILNDDLCSLCGSQSRRLRYTSPSFLLPEEKALNITVICCQYSLLFYIAHTSCGPLENGYVNDLGFAFRIWLGLQEKGKLLLELGGIGIPHPSRFWIIITLCYSHEIK